MIIDEPRVLPECFGDTLWTRFVLERSVNHCYSGGAVANAMKDRENQFALGIVDNDKTKPSYFGEFDDIKASDGLRLLQKRNSKHFVIFIDPAIEKWLLDRARDGNIRHEYTLDTLKKVMKSQNVEKDQKLKNFLNTIKQKNIKGVNDFKDWCNELIRSNKI